MKTTLDHKTESAGTPAQVGIVPGGAWVPNDDRINRRLNLGSGDKVADGWVDFDVTKVMRCDVQGTARRLPFQDESFVEAKAEHVLEHIPKEHLIETVNECWRVLRPEGELRVEVPLFPSDDAMADPTHVSFFVPRTFDYFDQGGDYESHRVLYGIKPWRIVSREHGGMNSLLLVVLRKVTE